MNFIYKTATQQDIDILVTTRIEVLRAANKLADQVDMSEVAAQSRDYYEKALKDGSHTAILVYAISLEATEMGRPLYEKFGFTGMNDEMELKKSV